VEEWEEPLHPGPLAHLYPTFPHRATLIAHFLPQTSTPARVRGRNTFESRRFGCGETWALARRWAQARVRIGALQAILRSRRGSVRYMCLPWGAVGRPSKGLRATSTWPLRCVVMTTGRSLALALICALTSAIAIGCGSSSSGSGGADDPASLVPATAPVYAEAALRPNGKVGADLDAALKKILRTDDPGAKIQKALDDSGRTDGVTYKDDIEPWLGDRAGIAVTAIHGSNADFVAVINSKDDGKASDALAKTKGDIVKRSYKGVVYRFDRKDGTAAGVFDHSVVVGTEPGFKSAVDASKGDSLADSNGLRGVRSKVAQERVGLLYLDVDGLLRAVSASAGSQPEVGAVLQSLSAAVPKTIGAALQAQADALKIDGVSLGTPKSGASGASGADMVAGLPGDSWLALGFGKSGQTLEGVLDAIGKSGGITGVGVNALLSQFQQQTGLDLRKDVLSWMGDAGVFVAGKGLPDLGGGLVVKTSDPAKTKKVIAVLRRLAGQQAGATIKTLNAQGVDEGFTLQPKNGPRIDVALAGEKFIVAVGAPGALKEAIAPSQPLSSAPAFTEAAGKLGDGLRPSFYLDFQQVVSLISGFVGNEATFQKAKPYLDTFGAIVAGAKDEGDGVTRARFVVTLK
jgi:hypothetical protein